MNHPFPFTCRTVTAQEAGSLGCVINITYQAFVTSNAKMKVLQVNPGLADLSERFWEIYPFQIYKSKPCFFWETSISKKVEKRTTNKGIFKWLHNSITVSSHLGTKSVMKDISNLGCEFDCNQKEMVLKDWPQLITTALGTMLLRIFYT